VNHPAPAHREINHVENAAQIDNNESNAPGKKPARNQKPVEKEKGRKEKPGSLNETNAPVTR